MSGTIIIAENVSGGTLEITDLGIEFALAETRTLTDEMTLDDITESDDLKTAVSNSNVTINDGVTDLTITEALDLLNIETVTESSNAATTADVYAFCVTFGGN